MPYLEADTGSSGPCWGKKEQTMVKCASLTIGTMASHNSKIPTFVGNSV